MVYGEDIIVQEIMEQTYVKLSQREHVYKLPDSYVGSVEKTTVQTVVVDADGHIETKQIEYIPALYKIYDEVLVNAIDQFTRRFKKKHPVTRIDIDVTSDRISITNNGLSIPLKRLALYDNVYAAELIFGELLTSSNYNENEQKVTGGKNGFGAKLANIFSTDFRVTTVSKKKKLELQWSDNMRHMHPMVLTPYEDQPYTQVSFAPDFVRFGATGISADEIDLFRRRAWDTAAWTGNTVSVYFNGSLIECNNFASYASDISPDKNIVHIHCNKHWEIAATTNDNEVFEHVSLVNGISTTAGGTHVNSVCSQISEHIASELTKKHKTKIKPSYVKNQLKIFVKATIVNPSFDSQTKERLTTNPSKFGSRCIVKLSFINRLMKDTDIEQRVMQMVEYKDGKKLSKSDGRKTNRVKGIPKLCDANKAGGRLSQKCTLILTEGDSAKTMAVAGLTEVGRDLYGVYPLRGKLLNVKDADYERIAKNSEITDLKKILGLKEKVDYSKDALHGKTWPLRYGKIIIMTDQDVDGSHIKGLIMNVFHSHWKTLLTRGGFVTSLLTPIIKATHVRDKITRCFYNMTDYEDWKAGQDRLKAWKIKYYKGLGTSTTREAKGYFKNMKLVEYVWDTSSDTCLDLAFSKNKSSDRKRWLENYRREDILDTACARVCYSDFINKDLIHFSNYNLRRSIPSVLDGLKPSQRKVLFACFKRNLTNEIKVAQLAGYVSEHAAYHHGENSLQDTIVSMAQTFVGSNNINLLEPNGTFGSRLHGGKDAASSRYIFTQLSSIARKIFPIEDDPVLTVNTEDGVPIEPETYVPIIPMVLVNGAMGIGTGYSTNILMHNPQDIIDAVRSRINQTAKPLLNPWYKHFTGTIKQVNGNATPQYVISGKYVVENPEMVRVVELPVGTWTSKYIEYLERLVLNKTLTSYTDHSTESTVDIILQFPKPPSNLGAVLKLKTKKYTSNMYLFNKDGCISKYSSVDDIVDEFFSVRWEMYERRKSLQLEGFEEKLAVAQNKTRFVTAVLDEHIDLRLSLTEISDFLVENDFDLGENGTYDYLTGMRLASLSRENVDKLIKSTSLLEEEMQRLRTQTVADMWLRELDDLERYMQSTHGLNA
jgi:DNA topoisomerase-2